MTIAWRRENMIETSKEVHIPNVGVMVRVERQSLCGEVIDIEYHRLPMRTPLARNVA
jgi:hypothetical protein